MNRWMAGVLTAMAMAACGDDRSGPTGPSTPGTRSGVWTGTAIGGGRSDSVRLELAEEPLDAARSLLRGTWSVTTAAGVRTGVTVIGTLSGTSGTLTLTPQPTPVCATPPLLPAAVGTYVVSALSVGNDSLRGNYQVGTCQGAEAGVLDVRR